MKTALLVIDMQNAFIHADGENFYPAAPKIVAPALALISAARHSKTIIVHVADVHRAGFKDYEQIRLPEHGLAGSFDAAFFDNFGRKEGHPEIEITKRRYSAFFGTDLALFLREQGVDDVIICGVKTNVCVRATAQDAFANGFQVQVVRDAVNTNRAHLGDAALEDIERYLGRVISQDDAIEVLG